MENLLKNLEELREEVVGTIKLLDIDGQKSELKDLKREASDPEFWNNQVRAIEVGKKMEDLEKEINDWENLRKEIRELEELVTVGNKEGDMSIEKMANDQYDELREKFERLHFLVLFSGKYDKENAIVSFHAGTGGVDAQDWAEILERMYLRFAEKHNWKVELVDRTVGNEAGLKSATYHFIGRWAFGHLRSENGVHRLVRISPFDAEQMRHTSFALVEVIPELPETESIEIREEDLRVDVFRSSGPGGQSVNTTDSAVRIVHTPTNVVATCQTERSQHQNRDRAMKILKAKLFKLEVERREQEEAKLKGETQKAEWGKQIRSYVMQPYKMVKDHRTNEETQEIDKVLDGELDNFMQSYLRSQQKK